ncbi:MAG: hypothetical protein ACE5EE_05185 [Fidelibacterota bacterium]
MKWRIMKIIFVFFILLHIRSIYAEPYIAIRTGFKCSQCHVNLTGGGKRTDLGNIFTLKFLPFHFIKTSQPVIFSPQLSRTVSVGANLRIYNSITYGYIDTSGILTPDDYLLDITEGNIYMEVRLIPEVLTLYFDQMVSPNPGNREAFGILQGLPFNGYIKTGKILLPYGLRLWDDNVFIREATGFNYSSPELAGEMGFEPGNFSISSAITSDQFSGLAYWIRKHGRVGFSWQKATDGSKLFMLGSFVGFHAGRFTFLSELDRIQFSNIKQQVYFAELDFLLVRGSNFKLSYNLLDRNLNVPIDRDGQERITLGWEVFPIQFFQFSIYYHFNRFIPQNISLNRDMLEIELHFFF